MSEAEFARVLEQLAGKTKYVYYHLMGEPLVHPQLPRFLEMAREKGFQSILTTNGTLLSARGEALLDAGLHKISISVHSLEHATDEAVESYLNSIVSFAERAAARGVIVVFRLWNRGCDEGLNDKVLRLLRTSFSEAWTENSRSIRMRDKVYLEYGDRFAWPDRNAPVQGESVFCYGLRDQFGVLSDGTVVPCCLDSEGVVALGNLFTDELSDILASERAKAIVEGFSCRRASEELCRRCAYAQRF